MKTVGLTGGIACGKSTVAALLRARGVPVLDADQASRAVTAPGSPALAEIAARFGQDLIGPDGVLDRKALGARIVGDPEGRRDLEAITHPRIYAALEAGIAALAAAGHAIAVIEAALMVETGSYRRYDALLVVRASPEVQVLRLCSREGMAEQQARAWLAAQMPVDEKARLATAVIDNDGDRAALEAATERAWATITAKLGLSTG